VVLESTGTQFLGVYHGQYPTTPNLQAEEGNALIFGNFYSNAGYTLQSFLPLVLSLYPGVGWEIYASSHPDLAGTSAAQVLHGRGYRTAFMTGATLDFRDSRRFFDRRGFDVVRGCEDFQRAGIGSMVSSWGMDDPPLFDALFDWIRQAPARPFYAVVWTQQTHHPYAMATYQHPIKFALANPTSERSELLNLYLNDLRIADQQLGRLFAFLRQQNLANDTLVVITGDHGEAFGFPHPWMFHGTALYQESVNVPCILWNSKTMAGRGRSDAVGAHVDLNPTIFDLLGIAPPTGWQGTSLLSPAHPPRAYFSCNTGNLLEGMRDANMKFIYNVTLAREELYDLDTDPQEQRNLASQRPDTCREYRRRLSAWGNFERTHLKTLIGG
jgi:arylsulfatase A-like enzyme